ncbi:MAG: hypothetical protein FWG08_01865 [Propionibacteriaceae bacterium]|nr:hypothetical protein [Propionibacteriaceae bacterium]
MIIDGIEYVKADEIQSATGTDHLIVIATNGWIFEGYGQLDDLGRVSLTNASVVRSWSNGKGIGALADPDYKDDYKRDPIGCITVHAVIAVIEARW